MKTRITISRQAADYLQRTTRTHMEDACVRPDQLAGLQGQAFVERWRAVQRQFAKRNPKGAAMSADYDADIEKSEIPVFLDVSAALAGATGSMNAKSPDVVEEVCMSVRQRAAFAEIAALQGATVGETLLVLAGLWLSTAPGNDLQVTMALLGDGFRHYSKRREVPENQMYQSASLRQKTKQRAA